LKATRRCFVEFQRFHYLLPLLSVLVSSFVTIPLLFQAAAPQVLEAVPLSIPDADAKPSQPQKQMEL
jgi:hypothetical protein